jgi:hypothetical protein
VAGAQPMAETGPRHRRTTSVVARPAAAARATTCSGGLSTGTEWVMHRATSRRWELTDEVGGVEAKIRSDVVAVLRGGGALVNIGGQHRALQLLGGEMKVRCDRI